MKKITIKLSLAALAVLGSTTLFAGAVAEGPQIVHSGETIHLDGSQSFTEQRGNITEPKWYIENLTHPVREVTPIVSQELSASITAPEVNETTEFRYTLSVVGVLFNKSVEYSKSSIVVTVEPTSDEANATISHEGFTYGTVVSPITGRTWLDRNLGATKVCTSVHDIDPSCIGAYYQWGRNTDGHQLHDSALGATVASLNTASDTFSEPDALAGNSGFYDWVDEDSDGAIREERWSSTDGSSVCPVGYRVPTPEEFSAETNLDFLNFSYGGFRNVDEPHERRDDSVYFWTTHMISPERASDLILSERFGRIPSFAEPVDGLSVRCIKD